MACGTGKTFTALKLVEEMVPAGGSVLFLVPSISLLSQTVREWTAQVRRPMRSFAVCSDVKVGVGGHLGHRGILTDYKVLILAVDEGHVGRHFRRMTPNKLM